MWKDRILSAAAAIAATAALTAIILYFFPLNHLTEGQLREGITYEVTGVPADTIVASVDGNGAPAELLTYEIGYTCSYLDYMMQMYTGEGLDLTGTLPTGENAQDYVKNAALDSVKQLLVLENVADRVGVTLSEEDQTALDGEIAELIEAAGGEDAFRAELYRVGLTLPGYERMSRASYLYSALHDAYTTPGSELYATDDTLHAYAVGLGYISADHILLSTVDPTTRQPLDEATVAEKRTLAEDILAQLRSSKEPEALFTELANQYSEDPGRVANPEGYTFTTGEMVEAFETAAYALDEGQISDIVESDYGFHILLRKPLDVDTAVEIVRDGYFDAFLSGEIEQAEVVVEPVVDSFDVAAIFEAVTAAQATAQEAAGETAQDAADETAQDTAGDAASDAAGDAELAENSLNP